MFFFILVLICGWGYNKVKDGGPKEDCTKRPDWMPEPGWENVRQKGGFISHGGTLRAGRISLLRGFLFGLLAAAVPLACNGMLLVATNAWVCGIPGRRFPILYFGFT